MKIALDVDDVIAAFTPHAFNWYGVDLRKTDYWSVPNMNSLLGLGWFDRISLVREFWRTLPAYSKPSELNFDFDCYISSFPEEMREEREKWLVRNGFPPHPLIVAHDKLKACQELGIDVLVDDKRDTIMKLQGSSVQGIHFMTKYAGFEPIEPYIMHLDEIPLILQYEIRR